jgi:hypothetical protein
MVAIEPILARAGGRAAAHIGKVAIDKVRRKALLDRATALLDRASFDAFVTSLNPAQGAAFLQFLQSPQFEHLALQATVWHLAGCSEDDMADIRHSVRLSLRTRVSLPEERLLTATDLVVHLLTLASGSAVLVHGRIDSGLAIGIVADLAAATARGHELLERLPNLRAVDQFSRLLRAQVTATKSKMRLAHLGRRAGVEYADLHVDPAFRFPGDSGNRSAAEALGQFKRVVVLGDPGAGKSTFAVKLAHDLAGDAFADFQARVPFLVVVREHAEALRTRHRPLAALLEDVARAPYNISPPDDAIEYLLLSGVAVVIIDGVDELGDAESRRRLAELVEAFAHQYPLVSIVVTTRIVGYDEAALDSELFPGIRIAPFTEEQVADYAGRWFTLEQDEPDLALSFLTESDGISDLRSNPLVLSLLCSLYESKHYIPINRAQIYENCAELLFERWDQGRGMAVPMRFGTHLRPAVARLAWRMFTDPSAGQLFSREQAADLLIEYMLEERFDDWTEAAAAATDFLDHCAGRAWLLTEMGIRDGQRVYGFTHRTFLEYFTAVHLTRLGPSPHQVWQRLSARIPDATWRTVAHLAVHRLERDCEGGGSGFMELLLDAAAASTHRVAYLDFGAEVSAQIGLRSGTLRRLAYACVQLAGGIPVRMRFSGTVDTARIGTSRKLDRPLSRILKVDLPENVSRLGPATVQALSSFSGEGQDESVSSGYLGGFIGSSPHMAIPGSVGEWVFRDVDLYGNDLVRRWVGLLRCPSPEDVREHGAGILFKGASFASESVETGASRLLRRAIGADKPDANAVADLERLYPSLIDQAWPWIRVCDVGGDVVWIPGMESADVVGNFQVSRLLRLSPPQRSAAVLLLLGFIQSVSGFVSVDPHGPIGVLCRAQATGQGRADAIDQVKAWGMPRKAHDLVVRWINDEASPVVFEFSVSGR